MQLSRLTRNDAELDLQPKKVSELFDIIASQAASRIERAGFTLALEPGGDAEIDVDTDAFTQVFVNLIDNAIKFSGKAATKSIEIASTIADGRATFSIRDFGPGIPRDQMKKIFRLFYRTERELTRETVGTGIGLALVHELVSAMHGDVDVVDRDPGAEFRIRIPLASV